jgi:hypothetical protein
MVAWGCRVCLDPMVVTMAGVLSVYCRKHWVEFRKRHGWADEELYDKYGEPLERTDGGRKIKHKRGKLLPHASEVGTDVSARCVGGGVGEPRRHGGRVVPGPGPEQEPTSGRSAGLLWSTLFVALLMLLILSHPSLPPLPAGTWSRLGTCASTGLRGQVARWVG